MSRCYECCQEHGHAEGCMAGGWRPHQDYAGGPMEPGQLRDPPDTDTPERELIERQKFTHEELLEIIDALRGWAKNLRYGPDQAWLEDGADALEALLSRVDKLEEALNAIIDRAPERDIKWAGMTARDIAIHALNRSAS